MRKLLTLTFILLSISISIMAQTPLPTRIELKLSSLWFRGAEFSSAKFDNAENTAEITGADDRKMKAHIVTNTITIESLLVRAANPDIAAPTRISLGSINFNIDKLSLMDSPSIAFSIQVGDSVYSGQLSSFVSHSIATLNLSVPTEIRIPIDRLTTAVLKLENKIYFNQWGTFPIEADLSIEGAKPRLRSALGRRK